MELKAAGFVYSSSILSAGKDDESIESQSQQVALQKPNESTNVRFTVGLLFA
jgi:hypothetical protein